jgi:8-oxo-dGTP diphosphatase
MPNLVGCVLIHNDRFIILQRKSDAKFGLMWGLPAGKVENGETDTRAAYRETIEETGIDISDSNLELLESHISQTHGGKFSLFKVRLTHEPEVKYDPEEHMAYKWVTLSELSSMNDVVPGLKDLLVKLRAALNE